MPSIENEPNDNFTSPVSRYERLPRRLYKYECICTNIGGTPDLVDGGSSPCGGETWEFLQNIII